MAKNSGPGFPGQVSFCLGMHFQLSGSIRRIGVAVSVACAVLLGLSDGYAAQEGEMRSDLEGHVCYLSQPKLKGRKTRSAGARLARQYIEKEFRANGIVPWATARTYELPFGLGVNVVGMVPGSDANVAQEIVLLCAHYDHLGKDRKGRIYAGAADNASGVAVLVEAARRFGSSAHRAKRTIALAAFDAEEQMLLGSFAFSCRTDVESAKIVAVINVDMLGRDFLDAITNTVFVAGTEGYPDLQSQVRGLGSAQSIRILTLGSDLIGPRSDHVAFETRPIPCLLFSCGTFADYHQPGDTTAKLNFDNLAKSTEVILGMAETLANADANPPVAGSGCDREELKSVQSVLSELCQDPAKAGIKTNDVSALVSLRDRVEKVLDKGNYNPKTREEIILEAARSLGGYFLGFGEEGSTKAQGTMLSSVMPFLEHIYLKYHRQLVEGQRQLISQVLKHPPGLFHGVPEFHYEIYDIAAEDILVAPAGNERFALHALGNNFTLAVRCPALIWPFRGVEVNFSGGFEVLDCEGTRAQLVDYCLLYGHSMRSNQLYVAALGKVLKAVSGSEPQGGYSEWLQAQLSQNGWESETEWVISCLSSREPGLVHEALTATRGCKDPRAVNRVREIIRDRDLRPDLRAYAMQIALEHADKATLLTFTEVLDDRTIAYRREDCVQFGPDYPLADRTIFQTLRPLLENMYSQPAKTIGEIALENLKKATRRNFGAEPQKWRAFLQKSK